MGRKGIERTSNLDVYVGIISSICNSDCLKECPVTAHCQEEMCPVEEESREVCLGGSAR